MKVFQLETLGDLHQIDRLVVHAMPQPIGAAYVCLVTGRPLTGTAGADGLTLSTTPGPEDDTPGTVLSDFLGNTTRFLMVSSRMKAIFQKECGDLPLEIFGFQLLKPDGGFWTDDYAFLNPLNILDVLNYEKSSILRFKDTDRIIKIKNAVLDAKKADTFPKLFRVKHWESNYLVREDLAETLLKAGATNLVLKDVTIS